MGIGVERFVLTLGFLAIAVLVPLTALEAWRYHSNGDASRGAGLAPIAPERTVAEAAADLTPVEPRVEVSQPSKTATPTRVDLRLLATRGSAWVDARAGPAGRTLF